MLDFGELWKHLNDLDETVEIEAKTAEKLGSAILESVSAFANEPGRGGGYLMLGVRMATDTLFPTYEIVGVEDADQLQADLATQCRTKLNRPVRPEMFVENRDGRRVVVAFIPEAQPSEKPVYITSRGLPKGAFRRIGSTDQKCTEDDPGPAHIKPPAPQGFTVRSHCFRRAWGLSYDALHWFHSVFPARN